MTTGSPTAILDVAEPKELEQSIRAEAGGVVVEFWSTWCAPCRVLRPHLERLARQNAGEWRFVAVHAESHPQLAQRWSVQGTPTLIYLRDREERHRTVGAVTPSMIEATLAALT